jgi:hypothetical protein
MTSLGMGRRIGSDEAMAEWTTTHFKISHAEGSLNAGVDGESMKLESPAGLRIVPKGLRFLGPAQGERSRPVKPLSVGAAKSLWQLIKPDRP